MSKRLFEKSWFVIVLCSLAVGACKGKKEGITAERKTIVESVYASATIKAADQYAAIPPVSGILLENLVKEGDMVTVGQVLAQIENTNPGLNADNARLAYDQAKSNLKSLDELEAQLNTAKQQYRLDSTNYARQKALWADNIGTKSQLEARQLAFEASRNNVKALQIRYYQTRNQLNTAVSQAANNYAITSKSSGDFSVVSKISGKVYSLNYKPGELVTAQKPVALIGKASDFIMELTVDEVDISRIAMGQKVVVSMDAYRDQIFEGKVSKIYPNLDSRSQSFIVEAVFVKGPPTLYPGMSAEASIVQNEKPNALVIPLSYLTKDDGVITEDGEVGVKVGMRNLEMVEILSGIDEKTKLIKP